MLLALPVLRSLVILTGAPTNALLLSTPLVLCSSKPNVANRLLPPAFLRFFPLRLPHLPLTVPLPHPFLGTLLQLPTLLTLPSPLRPSLRMRILMVPTGPILMSIPMLTLSRIPVRV